MKELANKLVRKHPTLNIYKDKRVLITGGSGFKGSWLKILLEIIGADTEVIDINTLSAVGNIRSKSKETTLFNRDICDASTVDLIQSRKYDFIFHLAAQPLVLDSIVNPFKTWRSNLMGTLVILETCRKNNEELVCLIVTSDKVYKNANECTQQFTETSEIGGKDPYSASKSACEIAVSSYIQTYTHLMKSKIATVRGGNVIGGGDYSSNRLIPDIFKAYTDNITLEIRSPKSTRPWQHVLDATIAYLLYAAKIRDSSDNNYIKSLNIGPTNNEKISVEEVCTIAKYNLQNFDYIIKYNPITKEHAHLSLDTALMQNYLKFKPVYECNKAVKQALQWYKNVHIKKMDRLDASIVEIYEYLDQKLA